MTRREGGKEGTANNGLRGRRMFIITDVSYHTSLLGEGSASCILIFLEIERDFSQEKKSKSLSAPMPVILLRTWWAPLRVHQAEKEWQTMRTGGSGWVPLANQKQAQKIEMAPDGWAQNHECGSRKGGI